MRAISLRRGGEESRRSSLADRLGWIGGGIVITLIVMAVFAPWLAPYDPTERVGTPFAEPSSEHWLGTNDVGQDLLSELIYGARVSLTVGIVAAVVALLIGTTVGVLAGYYPKRLGKVLMRTVDVVLIFPFLPLLIILAAYLGRSLINTIIVIGVLIWAGPARVIRSQVLSLRSREYVLASRTMGAPDRWAIVRHVLPRTALLATGTFVRAISTAILLEAALSFLGLGDPIQKIMAASLGFALIAFAMEERINPRL